MVYQIGGWSSMKKNSLWKYEDKIIRVLEFQSETALVIDCLKRNMPNWVNVELLTDYHIITEEELQMNTQICLPNEDSIPHDAKRFMQEHFTMIAGILPFISDSKQRCDVIDKIAADRNISKQTIRNYLCMYLTYQNISALVPMSMLVPRQKKKTAPKELTPDEKNMRWALNKFFYNKNQNSLNAAYTLMLKSKYCDAEGTLLPEYPTINQFRYFYRKTKKLQNYYISRDGIKNYQRNNRPLLGDGVQAYASSVGMGMLDATVCDIYLINESRDIVGRPILTACIDAYSSLCCGYMLSWEGGVYSLRGLMVNILTNKQEWCKQFGVFIDKEQWDSCKLPATFVTDMGSEYKSETFEQITEIGCTIINLPPYRPELKGSVEKFFDLIQNAFKPHLKGRGVIELDFQERGAHDYRKDACLTMNDFEKIILKCIIFYNSKRIIKNHPYTEAMLSAQIKPFACNIWEWGKLQDGANLISITKEKIILTLLPRTIGRFCRMGLKVNHMRYKNVNYTEKYLSGGEVLVAYNPDDVSCVWTIENGSYVPFDIIENRYQGKSLSDVETLKISQKEIVNDNVNDNVQTQAQIDLAKYIDAIASNAASPNDVSIKQIRNTRHREQKKTHIDYMREDGNR